MTCGKVAEVSCYDSHIVLNVPSMKPADGQYLQQQIENCKTKFASAIHKHQNIQTKFRKLYCCIKAFEQDCQGRMEENALRFAELILVLDNIDKKADGIETFAERNVWKRKSIKWQKMQMKSLKLSKS